MTHRLLPLHAWCLALALSAHGSLQAQSPPVVTGPESVADWFQAGNDFIAQSKALPVRNGTARNVILFVGDGMGISTVTAARILEGQMKGRPGEENRLSFDRFPHTALSKTYSWDQQTSDSAPTMTAIATGYKTREGMLSVNHTTARGECRAREVDARRVQSILELAAERGKATGIVTTARLTHATPAALYAHTAMRDWEADANLPAQDANTGLDCFGSPLAVQDIARQFIETSPTVKASLRVALGGGRMNFLPQATPDPEYPGKRGARRDGRDLTAEWLDTRGALGPTAYVWNRAQFNDIDPTRQRHLLGLFEPSHVQYEADKAQDGAGEPTLTEMTDKAVRLLLATPGPGFFLHVEGGRIDHAHHAGNARRALIETIEFSNAIARTVELLRAAGQLDDTLIVVTADHSHTFTLGGYPSRGNPILGLVRDVPHRDGNPLVTSKDKNGLPFTTLAYANGPGAVGSSRADLSGVDTQALGYLQQSLVPLDSETHAGEDVSVHAMGPQAHLVHGSMEQNWIFHVMREAFGVNPDAPALAPSPTRTLPLSKAGSQEPSASASSGAGAWITQAEATTAPSVPSLNARFRMNWQPRTAGAHADPASTGDAYFARTPQEVSMIQGAVEEVWHRNAQGSVSFERTLHNLARTIDYPAGELRTLGVNVSWGPLTALMDASEVAGLKVVGRRGSGPSSERMVLKGSTPGMTTIVEWLPALQLPARIERHTAQGVSRLTLLEHHTQAPPDWPRPGRQQSAPYVHLDAADFGDQGYEPAVQAAEAADHRRGWRLAHHGAMAAPSTPAVP